MCNVEDVTYSTSCVCRQLIAMRRGGLEWISSQGKHTRMENIWQIIISLLNGSMMFWQCSAMWLTDTTRKSLLGWMISIRLTVWFICLSELESQRVWHFCVEIEDSRVETFPWLRIIGFFGLSLNWDFVYFFLLKLWLFVIVRLWNFFFLLFSCAAQQIYYFNRVCSVWWWGFLCEQIEGKVSYFSQFFVSLIIKKVNFLHSLIAHHHERLPREY